MPEPGMGNKPEHSAPGRAGGTNPRDTSGENKSNRQKEAIKRFLKSRRKKRLPFGQFSSAAFAKRRGSTIIRNPTSPGPRRMARIIG